MQINMVGRRALALDWLAHWRRLAQVPARYHTRGTCAAEIENEILIAAGTWGWVDAQGYGRQPDSTRAGGHTSTGDHVADCHVCAHFARAQRLLDA